MYDQIDGVSPYATGSGPPLKFKKVGYGKLIAKQR